MLAKKIANKPCGGRFPAGFGARLRYACADDVDVMLANIAGDWRDAAFQMDLVAKLNPRMRSPVYHAVLTWAPSERPSIQQMFAAGHRAVRALGGERHQYVMAVHSNASGVHLHIILNQTHPTTGVALRLGHDFAKLEQVCRQIEVENGWPHDRGRFDFTTADGVVSLMPKPPEHWAKKAVDRAAGLRPDGYATRAHERRTGLPALRDTLSGDALSGLRRKFDTAVSWQDVHKAAADEGLQYVLYRSGARIVRQVGDWAMAACHLGTAYALRQMKKQLGVFVPPSQAHDGLAPSANNTATQRPTSALASFLREPLATIAAHEKEQRQVRAEYKNARQALRMDQDLETQSLRRTLGGKRNLAGRALRSVLRKHQRTDWRTWHAENPRPLPKAADFVPLLAVISPEITAMRSHRHRLRAETAGATASDTPMPFLDHTDVRQTWALAPYRAAASHGEAVDDILIRYPNDIRADHHGNLLIARRDGNGGIVGFDILDASHGKCVVPTRDDGGTGITILGPRDAATLLVVCNAEAALTRMMGSEYPPPMIVCMGKSYDQRVANIVTELARDRSFQIDLDKHPEADDIRDKLASLVPRGNGPERHSYDPGIDLQI